ncbi:Large ribosomal subunit protein uL13 OS=Streptomyces microflavus OX=1919 GN=rplM PE=3 SV=1 [Streptomyces microflavus]
MDMGDFVIIINADKVHLSGNKKTQKMAYRHSGFPGGSCSVRYDELLREEPREGRREGHQGHDPQEHPGPSD